MTREADRQIEASRKQIVNIRERLAEVLDAVAELDSILGSDCEEDEHVVSEESSG